MREIKFRLWDDKEKKWLLGYEYPNLGGFSMFGEVMLFGEYSKAIQDINNWEHLKLMQFTGLHDKNGKEIYEGDVLRGGIFDALQVVWDSELSGWNIGLNVQHYYEIIGNIYEHPNLIP